MAFEFTTDQKEIVDYLIEQIDNPEGQNVVVSGSGGTGKAQPNDTLIPTINGYKKLGDLEIGDIIFDRLGDKTKVIGVYPQGIKRCFEITFSDGRTSRSCDEHLWGTLTSKGNLKVVPLSDIIPNYRKPDPRNSRSTIYNYQIPSNGVVKYPKQDLPLDPYLIGVFLGDGCCLETGLTISCTDYEIINQIEKITGFAAKKRSDNNFHWDFARISPKEFFKETPELVNYSYNKTIPKQYLIGNIRQRLSLLQGLFDTDGSAKKEKNGIRFTSSSKVMIQQVREVCWSLGCHVGKILTDSRVEKYTKECYEININGPKELLVKMFRLQRKKETILASNPTRTNFGRLTINNIEEVEPCEMRCIKVDNPEHMYLTEHFIPTHNTTMVCELISELIKNGYRVAVTAMTGKATAVLRNKIFENIREKCVEVLPGTLLIETVSKLTKESKVLGLTESGETIYSNTWRDPKDFAEKYDVLFVDELSMIPHFISQWWSMSGIRVFGFGDECQLPEVCTDDTKREISGFKHDLKVPEMQYVSGYGVKVLKGLAQKQLHKVLRSDNEIALLCGDLRDFTQSKSQMIGRIKSWADKSEDITYSKSISDLRVEDDWQIICYTNKMCQKINNQLCSGGDYPDAMDKVILCDNLNPLKIYNGDTMLFRDFLGKIDSYNKHSKFPIYVCMKWQGRMPSKFGNNIERKFFNNYVAFKQKIKEVNIARLEMLPRIMRDSGYAKNQVENWIEDIEKFKTEYPEPGECFIQLMAELQKVSLDMAQTIMDSVPPMPRLYMITLGYGFAITVHKSQGSEYPKVCYVMERFDKPLVYTGLSRAKKELMIIDLTK